LTTFERAVAGIAARFDLSITRTNSRLERFPIEATQTDRAIVRSVHPITMTSAERVWSLLQAVRYVTDEQIPGAFAECGVWRGGSVVAMVLKLAELRVADREIWLYDTFEGMTAPTANDIEASTGKSAHQLMSSTEVGDGNNVWAFASQQDVEQNLSATGYPMERFHLIKGDVAQTLLTQFPAQIALLRLDTDWYESTRLGLEILYPRLAVGGVCILDDYGHWQGARKAVDEYFEGLGIRPLMHPIDYSGRVFIKTR
jgi:hypothetical protein